MTSQSAHDIDSDVYCYSVRGDQRPDRLAGRGRYFGEALLRTLLVCCVSAAIVAGQTGDLLGQDKPQPTSKMTYKKVGDVELKLHVFQPKEAAGEARPAIVFFFGGGWVGGNPNQFYPHCAHLAEHGVVAISAEYRIRSKHKTTPFDCVADGKSAIRFVRSHAENLGVDPDMIAAGGGSAGGHVAAATATVPALDDENDDLKVSARPNALVLFNPVYDNGSNGYGFDRVKERYKEISPMHNISKGMPPAIVFLGTEDKLIPVATAKEFQRRMKRIGSRSELKLYEGEGHGFFNAGRKDNKNYDQTVSEMDEFLKSLGYIK